MRKIRVGAAVAFCALLSVPIGLSVAAAWLSWRWVPAGEFRGIALPAVAATVFYLSGFAIYRAFLLVFPLPLGDIPEGSRAELVANVNTLFYLVIFYSLTRTSFIPVPLMRLIYQALGARLGSNSYSGGVILDPALTQLGDNCLVGHDAVLCSHATEGQCYSLERIRIGNNVTIGTKAIILPGVIIEDGAIVAAGAVVRKNTRIGRGETWGGVPARRIRPALGPASGTTGPRAAWKRLSDPVRAGDSRQGTVEASWHPGVRRD